MALSPPPKFNTINNAMGIESAKANANNISKKLQNYAIHEKAEFNAIRNSLKKTADMFLFGEPTPQMIKLLIKIYNENLLRIASDFPVVKLSCMFGILQDTDDNLYVTISEAPALEATNFPTDANYKNKRNMVLNLLRHANVTVKFPEEMSTISTDPFADEMNWRFPSLKNISLKKPAIFQTVKPYLFNPPAVLTKEVYDKNIYNNDITIKYVDSFQYLKDRKEGKDTFRPFKKYNPDFNSAKPVWRTDCNNGHLCTESKLFAYAKNIGLINYDIKPPIDNVKSFVAYWIGNKLPNEDGHVIKSYCYNSDSDNLEKLAIRCKNAIGGDFNYTADREIMEKMKYAMRPIAVACPGCFANITSYKQGKFVKWNTSNCYLPRRKSVGGKRRKSLNKRKTKKSRK